MINRIVTKGFGRSRGLTGRAGLIAQGYGGFFKKIAEVARDLFDYGRAGYRHTVEELGEIFINVRLILINDRPPREKIEGKLHATYRRAAGAAVTMTEHVSSKIKRALSDVSIFVKRVRR